MSREHPEWFLRSGGELVSNRGVLDFANPQVLAWAKSQIDDIVATHRLDYLKMDFNTDINVKADRDEQGNEKLWAHYRGLAELWRHIRERHPALIVENCSSGSLRQDVFPAAYTDTHWISDNIDPNGSLVMNIGATYLILADGRALYRSSVLTLQSEPVDVAVKLPAAMQTLTLAVEPETQGLLNFADWIRPRLEKE